MSVTRKLVFAGVALALLGGAGAWGAVAWHRSRPMVRAEAALAEGKLRDALLHLRSVSRDDPRNTAAPLLMARVYARLGDLLSAERELKRARTLGADRWEIMGQLGLYYLAERRFRDVLAETPTTGPTPAITARNLSLRSRAHTGMNDLRQAESALAQAAAIAPRNPEVLVAAARLAIARRDPAAVDVALRDALAADPNNLEALQLSAGNLAARGDLDGALRLADRAVAAGPGLPAPLLDRAGLLLAAGQDAKARIDVDAVLRTQPRNAAAIYLDSVLSVHEQRFGDALGRLDALGSAGSRFGRAAYFQAVAALAQNRTSTAVDAADRYVRANPGDPDGVRLLARAQLASGRADAAVKTLRAGVERGVDDAQTLDLLGTMLAATGDLASATDAYRQALAKAPEQAEIKANLASIETRQGSPGQAVAALERAAKSGAVQAGVLEALTVAQIAKGELDTAGETLARLRGLSGETEATGVLTGLLAMARLDLEGAVAAFTATLQAFPESTTAALNLARAQVAGGRREAARATIGKVLAADAKNIPALNSLVQLEVADSRFPQAARAIEAARALLPNDDGLVAMLADVQVRQGDPRRAISTVLRTRLPEARTPPILLALARAQEAAGQGPDAEASYAQALEAGPDVAAAIALAGLQARRGEVGRARRTLDEAIGQVPADFDLLTRRVQIEVESAGLPAGLAKAAALRADPAQAPTAAVLGGDALMRGKRPAEAVRAFKAEWDAAPAPAVGLRLAEAQLAAGDAGGAEATLRAMPTDPSAALLLSQMDIAAQRWPEAVRHTELALAGRPGDPALLNNLAFAYQRTGDARARTTAQRAYLLDPSADNADTLGWILVSEGAVAEAVPILRAAAAQRPDDALLAYHLAAALRGAGDSAGAVALLRKALGQSMPFDGRGEAEAMLKALSGR